jgi:hypothetical protein
MKTDLSLARVIARIEQIRDALPALCSAAYSHPTVGAYQYDKAALDACLTLLRQQQEQQQEIERLKALIIWPPSDSEAI